MDVRYGGKPQPVVEQTGAMKAGVPIVVNFHVGDDPGKDGGSGGYLEIVPPSDSNTDYEGVFQGKLRKGTAAASAIWHFGNRPGQFPLAANTDYSMTLTASYDCAGFAIKLLGPSK